MKNIIELTRYWENGNKIIITIDDYNKMLKKKDRTAISNMVCHRFYERYIKPFDYKSTDYEEQFKNGFAMMASSCLLIETLESFYEGLDTTQGQGEMIFRKFFQRSKKLKKFQSIPFYRNIRCGILHQAETTDGFTIHRKGALLDNKEKKINATKFIKEVKNSLRDYTEKLEKAEWDSEIWDNFRRKMRFIIKHCE